MIIQKFKSAKSVCIMHPPGCGGNHLANLISLCSGFAPRFHSNNYELDMLNHYKNFSPYKHKINSHFAEKHHLAGLYDADYMKKVNANNLINIYVGHASCYFPAIEFGMFDQIINPVWIILTLPHPDSLGYERMNVHGFSGPDFSDYVIPTEVNRVHVSENNGILLDTSRFIDEDGLIYVRRTLLTTLGINIPKFADNMHSLWIQGIRNSMVIYKNITNSTK